MEAPWLRTLRQLVENKPVVVLRFDDEVWKRLRQSRRGVNEFSFAGSHSLLGGVKVPTPCLVQGRDYAGKHLYFGLITSRSVVSTLESRLKIMRAVLIEPSSNEELVCLITEERHAQMLRRRLDSTPSVVSLSPKLSGHLVERLASIDANRGAMRAVAESLSSPKRFDGKAALQEDALRTALAAFGLTADDRAVSLELVGGRETALARVGIMEDSVIEHDARQVRGFDLVGSYVTGRAIFERGNERLEVFTANRRNLERVFGVDLIYLNAVRQNIVMLQYKMLEPSRRENAKTDWIYRPDDQLTEEIRRMERFAAVHPPGPHEYRLNPAVFFLKFVKRDGSLSDGSIIMPIGHFERLRKDPACRGPRKGLLISYETLAGRYLRQSAFLDLVRSGYIGGHAETTSSLTSLVDAVLNGERAVVAAIQRTVEGSSDG